MRRVDIRAPQLYRWQCDDCRPMTIGEAHGTRFHPQWHYVAAGVPETQAPAVFDREGLRPTPIGYRGMFDVCLPSCHSADRALIDKYIAEAKGLVTT